MWLNFWRFLCFSKFHAWFQSLLLNLACVSWAFKSGSKLINDFRSWVIYCLSMISRNFVSSNMMFQVPKMILLQAPWPRFFQRSCNFKRRKLWVTRHHVSINIAILCLCSHRKITCCWKCLEARVNWLRNCFSQKFYRL